MLKQVCVNHHDYIYKDQRTSLKTGNFANYHQCHWNKSEGKFALINILSLQLAHKIALTNYFGFCSVQTTTKMNRTSGVKNSGWWEEFTLRLIKFPIMMYFYKSFSLRKIKSEPLNCKLRHFVLMCILRWCGWVSTGVQMESVNLYIYFTQGNERMNTAVYMIILIVGA